MIAFVSMSCALFAQEEVKSIIERVSNADYIFEGKVISSTPYKTDDGSNIYQSNTIEITKIFKGDLSCGKVEVITNGGQVGDDICKHSEYLSLKPGNTGLFLCGVNEKQLSAISYFSGNNQQKLTTIFENQSYIKYYQQGFDMIASDATFNFDSIEKIYGITELVTQLTYTDCNNMSTVIGNPHGINTYHAPPNTYQFPVYQRSKYDSTMAHLNQKISITSTRPHVQRATKTLTYNIVNPIVTGTTTKYFEFDIYLTDDGTGYYFNSAMARIAYPSSIFGSNLVTANKIAVTRGTLLSDTVTYDPPTPADISSNEIAIPMGINVSNLGSLNLAPISTTPTQAVHVKMEIQSCNLAGSVSFTNQSIMQLISYYGTFSNDTFGTNYDNIIATDSKAVPSCRATITSFSPSSIDAGVGEILEIRGYQFGDNQGSGNVFFPNADDGGMSKTAMNVNDFFYWSDTLIKITLPSFCDTVQTSTGSIMTQPDSKPGSGSFIVVTDAGDKDTSSFLTVRYGIENYPTPAKQPFRLIEKDTNGGYQFYMDTVLWNNPNARACVYKAVADWKCLTGVSWSVVGSIIPTTDTARRDSINIIQMGYTGYSPLGTILGNTTTWGKVCGSKIYYPELDIVFNSTTLWWFDTTSTSAVPSGYKDFYATILHELGHAHVLTHVIDSNGVMHFQSQRSGPLPASKRKINIDYDAACGFGGNKAITISVAGTYSCTGSPLPIIPHYLCDAFTGVHNLANDMPTFAVYPNPFAENITVSYILTKESSMDMYVMDMQGRMIAQRGTKKYAAGEYNVDLHFNNIPSGQFIVWGHVNGEGYFKNVTCIH